MNAGHGCTNPGCAYRRRASSTFLQAGRALRQDVHRNQYGGRREKAMRCFQLGGRGQTSRGWECEATSGTEPGEWSSSFGITVELRNERDANSAMWSES